MPLAPNWPDDFSIVARHALRAHTITGPATGFSPFSSATANVQTKAEQATTKFMMVMLAAVLLVPYSMIALRRLSGNDWTFWSTDLLPFYIARNSFSESWCGFGSVGQMVLRSPLMLGALAISFPIVTVFEMLAPLCLLHRRFRHVWIVVIVGFHLSTVFLMDILFWESLLLFPVLLVDGDVMLGWFDTLRTRFSKDSSHQAEVCAVVADSVVESV